MRWEAEAEACRRIEAGLRGGCKPRKRGTTGRGVVRRGAEPRAGGTAGGWQAGSEKGSPASLSDGRLGDRNSFAVKAALFAAAPLRICGQGTWLGWLGRVTEPPALPYRHRRRRDHRCCRTGTLAGGDWRRSCGTASRTTMSRYGTREAGCGRPRVVGGEGGCGHRAPCTVESHTPCRSVAVPLLRAG
jgi:hypothetical protein